MTVYMQCGHAANATSCGKPSCAICVNIRPGASTVAKAPNLQGRKAVCYGTHGEVPSSLKLAFFEYRPDREYDDYYCGCRGWD